MTKEQIENEIIKLEFERTEILNDYIEVLEKYGLNLDIPYDGKIEFLRIENNLMILKAILKTKE